MKSSAQKYNKNISLPHIKIREDIQAKILEGEGEIRGPRNFLHLFSSFTIIIWTKIVRLCEDIVIVEEICD